MFPLLLVLLLQGCDPQEPESKPDTGPSEAGGDGDGDGFAADRGDCDDADASVHPDAPETCDGRDQDCDLSIDEGFADTDADGVPDCRDAEECDGRDNDGDGEVDEGYTDADGDGQADCIDDACDLASLGVQEVVDAPACEVVLTPPADPWDIEVVWEGQTDTYTCSEDTLVADLDHDGTGDVLCVDGTLGLLAFSGLDGHILWTVSTLEEEEPPGEPPEAVGRKAPLAIADVEGDGVVDIFTLSGSGYPVRLDEWGQVVWLDKDRSLTSGTDGPDWERFSLEVFDLGSDGALEIISNYAVASSRDGEHQFSLGTRKWNHSGRLELALAAETAIGGPWILNRDECWNENGVLQWQLGMDEDAFPLTALSLLQADEDDGVEIAYSDLPGVFLSNAEGDVFLKHDIAAERTTWSITCTADVDGDGSMDLVYGDEQTVYVMASDGHVIWSQPIYDPTETYVTCTTFDFDLDGDREVLFADMDWFYIFDGADGTIRFQDWLPSGTVGDVKLVVDLDGDGSVEIVATTYGGWGGPGVRVYRNVHRDWPPGSRIWPSTTWSGTGHQSDLTVPRTPEAPWLTTRLWRGQPTALIPGTDLRPEIVDACVSRCEGGDLRLALRLVNLGPEEVRDGATAALYTMSNDSLQQVVTFPGFLDNSQASATVEVRVPWEQARSGLRIVAGDAGSGAVTVVDCDLGNNTLEWVPEFCR